MRKDIDRRLADRIQLGLYIFLGFGNLGLWYVGHAYIVAAILGGAFLAGGAYMTCKLFKKVS